VGLDTTFSFSLGARVLIVAGAISLALALAIAPRGGRLGLLLPGLAALAALAAIAASSLPAEVPLLVLLAAAGQAALPGVRSFPLRLRGPAFGVALLTLGAVVAHYSTAATFLRLAAVLLALGLVATAGLLPFLQPLVAEEAVPASPVAWTGFVAPALAIALPIQALVQLDRASAGVYGGLLVALGVVNIVWGGIGAWRAADAVVAWRHSFVADWGLALVGLGLLSPSGGAAALLALVFVILVRLPLYLIARPVLLGEEQPHLEPAQLLAAAVLAGAAPFAGFPARLLLIKSAGDIYWPLALVLVAALLLWLPASLRLARTISHIRGRRALAAATIFVAAAAIGLYPAPLIAGLSGG
jgi:formate hydrogenlyase subunit 3/multisubunit Na+/H+ antiporter MnhD subunit